MKKREKIENLLRISTQKTHSIFHLWFSDLLQLLLLLPLLLPFLVLIHSVLFVFFPIIFRI